MSTNKKTVKPPDALREAAKAMRVAADQGIADAITRRGPLDGYSRAWLGGYRHGMDTVAGALEHWANELEQQNGDDQ